MKKITAENFITDNKTNKVFLSSLIDKTSGALDVDTRSKLKSKIKDFCPDCELLYNTMDVWARDYMPIQLTEDVFLSFTYRLSGAISQLCYKLATAWGTCKRELLFQHCSDAHYS